MKISGEATRTGRPRLVIPTSQNGAAAPLLIFKWPRLCGQNGESSGFPAMPKATGRGLEDCNLVSCRLSNQAAAYPDFKSHGERLTPKYSCRDSIFGW